MCNNKIHNFRLIFKLLIFLTYFCQVYFANADIIQDGWANERAYRPAPILFLHGFASGSPEVWERADSKLWYYFDEYRQSDRGNLLQYPLRSSHQYLEMISFWNPNDPWRQRLIDRNSSVDTYQAGDYYVLTGERMPGDPGWSDKVDSVINPLLDAYGTNKLILVCHSMGGLAAREYFRQRAGTKAEKLITIATPHLGSYLASIVGGIRISQKIGWFLPIKGWAFSFAIEATDSSVEHLNWIDIDGDAVRDMTPNSDFLRVLNSTSQPPSVDYFAIIGDVWWHYGDGVVELDSQRGFGVLSLKDYIMVHAGHGDVPLVAAEGDPSPILQFIDYNLPEVEITEPNPNASPIPEITTLTTNLKGKVMKEYLPADTTLQITVVKDEDGSSQVLGEDGSIKLKPSDLWVPSDPNSPVAEFDKEITFWGDGTYTIRVIATNPAKINSVVKLTRIKVVLEKPIFPPPIISDGTPTGKFANRRPRIQAGITPLFAHLGVYVDLSSIVMTLDGTVANHSVDVSPVTGTVTVYYTPDIMSLGLHTVTVNASDTNGVAADEEIWTFEILKQPMVYFIRPNPPLLGVGLIQSDPTFDTSLCRFGTMTYKLINKEFIEPSRTAPFGGYHYYFEFTLIPDEPNYASVTIYFAIDSYQFKNYDGMEQLSYWAIVEKTVIANGVNNITDLLGILAYMPNGWEVRPQYISVDGVYNSTLYHGLLLPPPKGSLVYGISCYETSYERLGPGGGELSWLVTWTLGVGAVSGVYPYFFN